MDFTHELISYDTKYFEDNTKFQDVINNYFEEIYDIKLDNYTFGKTMIMVKGKMHLYGFLVQDGGFFDVYNNVYYDEDSPFLKNATITRCENKKRILN